MSFEGADGIFTGFVIAGGAIVVWLLCLDTPEKIQVRLMRVNERIAESANGDGGTSGCGGQGEPASLN
jgi:hypothetical protein